MYSLEAEDHPPLEAFSQRTSLIGRAEHWKNRGEGGMGLGLALSSKMAEIQNGSLEIESDGRNGTTCRISLPAAA